MTKIYYEKVDDEFVLFIETLSGRKDIHYRGREVAVGFTYDPDQDRAIQFTTHRHGSPETVNKWAEKMRSALQRSRFTRDAQEKGETAAAILRGMQPHIISSDQWNIKDLNRILDTTGYLAVIVKKMGITISAE